MLQPFFVMKKLCNRHSFFSNLQPQLLVLTFFCLQDFLYHCILPIYLALYPGDLQHGALVCEAIAGGQILLCAVMQVRQPIAQGAGAVQQPIKQGGV